MIDPVKLLIRNLCKEAIDEADELQSCRWRAETSIVDNQTIQVEIYDPDKIVPDHFVIRVERASELC